MTLPAIRSDALFAAARMRAQGHYGAFGTNSVDPRDAARLVSGGVRSWDRARGVDVVSARFPADAAYIGTVRLLAAGLAARCDLTLDDIEDLRLAIDEACVLLLASADADGSLEVRFELSTRCVGAELSATGAGEPDRRGLSWAVLAELASTVAVTSPDGRVVIALSKRREDVSQ